MRLNRITLASLNQNEVRTKKEINALNNINRLSERLGDNVNDFSAFSPIKDLKDRNFNLAKFEEIRWNIPQDTMILMAYQTGFTTQFAQIETNWINPLFASVNTEELDEKIDNVIASVNLGQDGKLKSFDYESASWIYKSIFEYGGSNFSESFEKRILCFSPRQIHLIFRLVCFTTVEWLEVKTEI